MVQSAHWTGGGRTQARICLVLILFPQSLMLHLAVTRSPWSSVGGRAFSSTARPSTSLDPYSKWDFSIVLIFWTGTGGSHESPEYFVSDDNNLSHGLVFAIEYRSNLPILQWAINKCAELHGQKLTLKDPVVNMCIMNGHEDMLDLLLRSTNLLTMDWNCDIVDKAVHGQIDLLEWWDRHRNELPPQNLDCARRLTYPAQQDAVDVLAWWHARGFPATKSDWHRAYSMAISMDARRVILWLRDHPTLLFSESDEEYQPFVDACKTKLSCSKPYTLDIVATIVGDLESTLHPPEKVYTCMATLLWWCSRHNITVASLLPVDPSILDEMVNMRYVVMLDWWVQVHMAAGHRIVFPAANLLDEFCHWTIDTHVWMYDVMVTRKIPVFVQSERGVVPYMPPPLPFSV